MNQRYVKVTTNIEQLIDLFKSNLDIIEISTATRWMDIGWSVPEGTRVDFEINYFVKGKAEVELKGNMDTALPGDIFLVDNSKGNYCKTGAFALYFFSFYIKDIEKPGRAIREKIRQCLSMFPVGTALGKATSGINDKITKIYNDMIREFSLKRYGYELNLKLYAIQLFIELARAIELSDSSIRYFQNNKYLEIVSDIMAFFQENNAAQINLTELGNRYLLNPRYLNKIFKGATGLPILQYYQRVKLEKAKRLLSTSSLNILDIALELGFESGQAFSKFFRKNSGLTPTRYRRL